MRAHLMNLWALPLEVGFDLIVSLYFQLNLVFVLMVDHFGKLLIFLVLVFVRFSHL